MALAVIAAYNKLREKRKVDIARQLLRSGTSVGANIREALQCDTLKDFTYKMNLAQKECAECIYWLELIRASGESGEQDMQTLLIDATEVLRILRSIVRTSRQRLEQEGNTTITRP